MTPNIFSIAFNYYRLGDEDMVTALWHYVLCAVPGVGQAFVDDLCSTTNLPPARFVGALDHPFGSTESRPDLLLQCDKWNLLFEHKVDSPFGRLQLERYLTLAKERGWKLAVLAKNRHEISAAVIHDVDYVAPSDERRPRHFLWQDIQSVVRSVNQPLGVEFATFMEECGMGAFSWGGLGNPLHSADAASTLRLMYDSARPVFTAPGVKFVKKSTSLVYEVRRPLPEVHLINIGPIESVAQVAPALRGHVMALWVWVRRDSRTRMRRLPMLSGAVTGSEFPITVSDRDEGLSLRDDPDVFCERWYYAPLDEVLVASPEGCRARLQGFVRSCVEHVKGDLARA